MQTFGTLISLHLRLRMTPFTLAKANRAMSAQGSVAANPASLGNVVGCRRLAAIDFYLQGTGTGSPAVVMVGTGFFCVLIQPEAAKF